MFAPINRQQCRKFLLPRQSCHLRTLEPVTLPQGRLEPRNEDRSISDKNVPTRDLRHNYVDLASPKGTLQIFKLLETKGIYVSAQIFIIGMAIALHNALPRMRRVFPNEH
jgi:hypothetical protein